GSTLSAVHCERSKFFGAGFAQGCPPNPASAPRGWKIEPAGDAVDVEQLACKIKIWHDPAFHGFEIDLAQSHAAASDKLLFVQRFPIDFEFRRTQMPNQLVHSGARERRPICFRKNAGIRGQLFPESCWN